MKLRAAAIFLVLVPILAPAHRLDEYLQATILSIDKDQLHAEMTLTPGVAVFPKLASAIADQRTYAERVLGDLALTIDGQRLTPQLLSAKFPSVEEMKQGLGRIRIEFKADLPASGGNHKLIFENHHESAIGAYLVNSLVPRDPDLHITGQTRNDSQSHYELDYTQTSGPSELLWLGSAALILSVRFAVRKRIAKPTATASKNSPGS
jgi:hypothetical protein